MKPENRHQHCCENEEKRPLSNHNDGKTAGWLEHWPLLTGFLIVIVMLVLDYGFGLQFSNLVQLCIYIPAYLFQGTMYWILLSEKRCGLISSMNFS